MSAGIYRYGRQIPVGFKITLANVGVSLTIDTQLVDGDIRVIYCDRDGGYGSRLIDVSAEIKAYTPSLVPGTYLWTPAFATDTQHAWFGLSIFDSDGGGLFDENLKIWYTGGHPDAMFNAT